MKTKKERVKVEKERTEESGNRQDYVKLTDSYYYVIEKLK